MKRIDSGNRAAVVTYGGPRPSGRVTLFRTAAGRASEPRAWAWARPIRVTIVAAELGKRHTPLLSEFDYGAPFAASVKATRCAGGLRPTLTDAGERALLNTCRRQGECRSCLTKENASQRVIRALPSPLFRTIPGSAASFEFFQRHYLLTSELGYSIHHVGYASDSRRIAAAQPSAPVGKKPTYSA
jgi:hypothetical protein